MGTLIFVSHLDFAEGGILAEDTGTQSPAGEGDEAQLGIIKPSTVSMKGPGSQAGLVSPPDRAACTETAYTTVSLTLFPSEVKKRHKSDSDSVVESQSHSQGTT